MRKENNSNVEPSSKLFADLPYAAYALTSRFLTGSSLFSFKQLTSSIRDAATVAFCRDGMSELVQIHTEMLPVLLKREIKLSEFSALKMNNETLKENESLAEEKDKIQQEIKGALGNMDGPVLVDYLLKSLLTAIVSGDVALADQLIRLYPELLLKSASDNIQHNFSDGSESNFIIKKGQTPFQVALLIGHPAMCKLMMDVCQREYDAQTEESVFIKALFQQFVALFPGGVDEFIKEQIEKKFEFTDVIKAIAKQKNNESQDSLEKALSEFKEQFNNLIENGESAWNPKHLYDALNLFFKKTSNDRNQWDRDQSQCFWNEVLSHIYLAIPEHFLKIIQPGVIYETKFCKQECNNLNVDQEIYGIENASAIMEWENSYDVPLKADDEDEGEGMARDDSSMGGMMFSEPSSKNDIAPQKMLNAVHSQNVMKHTEFFTLLHPEQSDYPDHWSRAFFSAMQYVIHARSTTLKSVEEKLYALAKPVAQSEKKHGESTATACTM